MRPNRFSQDFFGAFADGAVLFPLLAVLTLKVGFSGSVLLLSASLAYIASGVFFRVPMSVQPLKSIAIAAVAVGASYSEVRWSGFVLGLFCLFISFFNVSEMSKKIPSSLVHGVQAGLGVLLILQGLKSAVGPLTDWLYGLIAVSICLAMSFIPLASGFTLLGLVATTGLVFAVVGVNRDADSIARLSQSVTSPVRFGLIMSLVFPQVALTLANSVVGTRDVCHRYFGSKSKFVTERRLLISIGVGNILSAFIGGLPFCHGAGGVTAHYQGGARTLASNLIIGFFLLILSFVQYLDGTWVIQYSPLLMGILLMATGISHLKLAKPTWQGSNGKIKLMLMISTVVITQNMLWVLFVGAVIEVVCLVTSSAPRF